MSSDEMTRPVENRYEFVIKIYPDGAFSQYLANRVQVGDRIEVEAPFGTCTLRESHTSDILFVGGGAGMAPLLGLLRSLAEKQTERKATLYYGARTRASRPTMSSPASQY